MKKSLSISASKTHHKSTAAIAAVLVWLLFAQTTSARIPPISPPDANGFRWATITHPGNAPTTSFYDHPPRPVGSVGSVYRMATTEVTVRQWYDFVAAYAPYYTPTDDEPFLNNFTTGWIRPSGNGTFSYNPAFAEYPVAPSWRNAARYVNWLNNDRRGDRAAFESGAYDTSTFSTNPNGTFTDQPRRSPGARYWLPSQDEWLKAAYFDPEKDGPDQPGWWTFPYAQDTQLQPGLPGFGQTNASLNTYGPVGQYPDMNAPWGLLDISGGEYEWSETTDWAVNPTGRLALGTNFFTEQYMFLDDRNWNGADVFAALSSRSPVGIRVASIPSPSGSLLVLVILGGIHRRRDERCTDT